MKIQLKHSDVVSGSTSVAPAAEYLLDGELAVAFNSFDPKIFFKTSDDTLVYLKAYSVDDDVTAVKLDVARTITLTGDPMTASFTTSIVNFANPLPCSVIDGNLGSVFMTLL